jgi:UDP-N-acetylmuramoylalanine--D-glutamate ligase
MGTMKIAILGYDVEGRASYDYFAAQGGHELTICDQNTELTAPDDVPTVLGEAYLNDLDRFDLLVRTPGLHPQAILDKNPDVASKITTLINEFLRVSPTKNLIGVTGTKGKGTTSTLITRLLEATGKTARLGGNIGLPPLTFLNELTPESWVVLELSNFQLIDLQNSPHIGVCLMVVPEHLNWHHDLEEYMGAKSNLFAHQKPEDFAIYFAESEASRQVASAGQGQKIPYYAPPGAYVDGDAITINNQVICRTNELKLPGKHNWQNVCAAVTAVWQAGADMQNIPALRSVLTTFEGLEHRIELVREVSGIRFYNDSFAAGLHATEAAIEAIDGKKIVVIGGYDRMLDIDHFGVFAKAHEDTLRTLLVIGKSAKRVAKVLEQANFTNYVVDKESATMPAIVAKARSLAQPGDAVVLSPGFASFDMFKNFEDRGVQFKKAVNKL